MKRTRLGSIFLALVLCVALTGCTPKKEQKGADTAQQAAELYMDNLLAMSDDMFQYTYFENGVSYLFYFGEYPPEEYQQYEIIGYWQTEQGREELKQDKEELLFSNKYKECLGIYLSLSGYEVISTEQIKPALYGSRTTYIMTINYTQPRFELVQRDVWQTYEPMTRADIEALTDEEKGAFTMELLQKSIQQMRTTEYETITQEIELMVIEKDARWYVVVPEKETVSILIERIIPWISGSPSVEQE